MVLDSMLSQLYHHHSGLIIQCHTDTPYRQDPNLGEDKGGLLGPKKDKYKVCSLLDKLHSDFGSRQLKTANSARLLDIKTEVSAWCGQNNLGNKIPVPEWAMQRVVQWHVICHPYLRQILVHKFCAHFYGHKSQYSTIFY